MVNPPEPAARRRRVRHILRGAARVFGRQGFAATTLQGVAAEVGLTEGEVQQHFPSKQKLLIEAQRNVFRELSRRFIDRARRGERGMTSGLDALDALWGSVRSLHSGAPFVVQTLALASQDDALAEPVAAFCDESTDLLEDGIVAVFADELDQLSVTPDRMAVLTRVLLEGLVVELARAHTPEALARVDQAYADLRELFERFAVSGGRMSPAGVPLEPLPLPW